MKEKYSDYIENRMLENIQVSDDVLNEAREELKKGRKRKLRMSLKILIPVTSCLLLCAILLPVLSFMLPQINKNIKEENSYAVSELDQKTISSVEVYNQQEFKDLFFANLEATTWLYSYNEEALLLQEVFYYDEIDCNLYIILSNNTKIEELNEFYSLSNSKFLCDIEIFYSVDEATCLARFIYGNEYYCLEVNSPIEKNLDKILEFILT